MVTSPTYSQSAPKRTSDNYGRGSMPPGFYPSAEAPYVDRFRGKARSRGPTFRFGVASYDVLGSCKEVASDLQVFPEKSPKRQTFVIFLVFM